MRSLIIDIVFWTGLPNTPSVSSLECFISRPKETVATKRLGGSATIYAGWIRPASPHRFIIHVLDPYRQPFGLIWTFEMIAEIEFDHHALYPAYRMSRQTLAGRHTKSASTDAWNAVEGRFTTKGYSGTSSSHCFCGMHWYCKYNTLIDRSLLVGFLLVLNFYSNCRK